MPTVIVEDGTGLNPLANSYIDAAFVSGYDYTSVWCDNLSKQEQALLVSARFLDMRYASWFAGTQTFADQPMQFPRVLGVRGCYPPNQTGIPAALKKAQAELALMWLNDPAALNLNANEGNLIQSESVSVGGGAVSKAVTYFRPKVASAFATVDSYIKQLQGSRNGYSAPIIRG